MTAEDDFVADLTSRLTAQGFPRIPAGVLMALTASESGSLGAQELAATLQVSPAAISGAVRYLTVLGFVRTATAPGTRRHAYSLSDVPWYLTSLTGTARYAELAGVLGVHAERLGGGASGARIGELASFFRFLDERMPVLLDEWLRTRDAPGAHGGTRR